ncbi:PCBP1 [Symbiodinium sp. CCMP2592]|nr:PCBP1 [Symbiodinium sp. CCMP2592]
MSLQFAVPAAIAAWIVGRKGQSINAIRAQSGASIDVSKEGARYRVIDIRGAEQALMSAIEMVVEQASTLPDGWTESIRIVLPAGTAGYIIGRGGEAIKELRRSSGAEMDLAQLNAGAEQLLVISGEVEVIVEAAQMVAGRIAEVRRIAPAGANAGEFQVSIDTTATVEELKEKVSAQVNIPAKNIRLVCVGRIWQDTQTVGSYEPKDGVVVHCLNNPQREAPPAASQSLAPANPMAQMMGAAPAPQANSGAVAVICSKDKPVIVLFLGLSASPRSFVAHGFLREFV